MRHAARCSSDRQDAVRKAGYACYVDPLQRPPGGGVGRLSSQPSGSMRLVSSPIELRTEIMTSRFSGISRMTPIGDREFRTLVLGLRPFVDSLHRVDADGQQLRYSETHDGRQSLSGEAICDLEVIRASPGQPYRVLSDLRCRASRSSKSEALKRILVCVPAPIFTRLRGHCHRASGGQRPNSMRQSQVC
jgi:hypothetical protein